MLENLATFRVAQNLRQKPARLVDSRFVIFFCYLGRSVEKLTGLPSHAALLMAILSSSRQKCWLFEDILILNFRTTSVYVTRQDVAVRYYVYNYCCPGWAPSGDQCTVGMYHIVWLHFENGLSPKGCLFFFLIISRLRIVS